MVSEGFFSMCSRNVLMKVKGKFSNNMDAIALLVYLLEMSNRETADATQMPFKIGEQMPAIQI